MVTAYNLSIQDIDFFRLFWKNILEGDPHLKYFNYSRRDTKILFTSSNNFFFLLFYHLCIFCREVGVSSFSCQMCTCCSLLGFVFSCFFPFLLVERPFLTLELAMFNQRTPAWLCRTLILSLSQYTYSSYCRLCSAKGTRASVAIAKTFLWRCPDDGARTQIIQLSTLHFLLRWHGLGRNKINPC